MLKYFWLGVWVEILRDLGFHWFQRPYVPFRLLLRATAQNGHRARRHR